jgi:uncharacterized membrane protein YeiB
MKRLHIYIIGIVIATFLCFALGQRMPRTFTWKATFAHADRQPFGCYVFDSVMAQSMPKGYSVGVFEGCQSMILASLKWRNA